MNKRVGWAMAPLVLGGALWWLQAGPLMKRNLSELPVRFEPIVLGPQAPLGREENGPFLSSDCSWEAGVVTAGSPLRSRLSFYVQSQTGLQLELQARFPSQVRQSVLFSLNGTGWLSCPLTSEWATFRADLPAARLRLGRNQLTMNMEVGELVQFRKFQISARSHPQTPFQQEELSLPWNSNLAVAVAPGRGGRLLCAALEAETSPGAAAVTDSILRVSLRGPGQQWQRDIPVTSGPLELALPTSGSAWSKLQLQALSRHEPLPGQLGLKLTNPQLEAHPPAPVPAVEPMAKSSGAGRPNVVLYLIDTLRADHLGCYGHLPSPSPCLDRFARDSVLFLDASAQSGWTKPATASIFSSQWPWRHRVQDFADRLPPEVPWLPQILQANGYQTAAVVTNRLAGSEFGYQRGYDSFRELAKDTSEQAQAETAEWLDQKRTSKPFFLYVHTIDPHAPYMHSPAYRHKTRAQAESIDQEPRLLAEEATLLRFRGQTLAELKSRVDHLMADYDREIANNDRSFGLLIEYLKAHGLYDNTLIIVVSDHGEEFLEHGYVGHLNSLYQELLHVPLLIKFPGQLGAGQRVPETWQQIDLAPTVLQACGIDVPGAFQGLAYRPGATPPSRRPCLFSVQAGRALAGLRPEDKQAIFSSAHGIRQGYWMYQRVLACGPGQREPEELYDLEQDPLQQRNLAESDPGRALSLAVPLETLFGYTSQALPASGEANRKLVELLKSLQYVR
ncbi:MAG: sulfatase [Candidatus Eremiobacteraeota bacterium]|nr:sulfatase [Candidatus Eremiobacteraeota bacterium]